MRAPRTADKHQRPKLEKYEQPIYTLNEEKMLFSILYRLSRCQFTVMAKHLHVKPQTVRIWQNKGFPNPWWGFVFRYLITRLLKYERSREASKHKKVWREALNDLQKIPNLDRLLDDHDIVHATDFNEAAVHVRTILYHEKKFKMSWDFIKKPAHSGGYSPAVLRRALRDVGAVKTTKGFGEDKEVSWQLPIDEEYER